MARPIHFATLLTTKKTRCSNQLKLIGRSFNSNIMSRIEQTYLKAQPLQKKKDTASYYTILKLIYANLQSKQ
jgi:hypothetical protein